MKTKSVFTGSYTEKPFWYQKFELRQAKTLRGDQPTADFAIADICRF